jgi:formylglycine-generating enzyme required for sulfatase activity
MVVLPAGSFTMGAPEGEKDRQPNEGPQHIVTIGKPFAVGKFHVTRTQFAIFAQETQYVAHQGCAWTNPGFKQEGSHPVVCVSWDDAKAYVDWLVKKTRKPYRLLSEVEWEYAARGQTSPGAYPRFWFGDDEGELCRYGSFNDQKTLSAYGNLVYYQHTGKKIPCNDGYEETSPVGHYPPNAFGLYDMFGNAEQWTTDCWHGSYNGAPVDSSAWTTGCQESSHVVRGGSFISSPLYLRAAARNRLFSAENGRSGFRVARTIPH